MNTRSISYTRASFPLLARRLPDAYSGAEADSMNCTISEAPAAKDLMPQSHIAVGLAALAGDRTSPRWVDAAG